MKGLTFTTTASISGIERVLQLPNKRPRVFDGKDKDGAGAGLDSCILYYLDNTDRTLASRS